MGLRDAVVAGASATVLIGSVVGSYPEAVNAYYEITTPALDVAAGQIALGGTLPDQVKIQENAVVSLDTSGVPSYTTIDGKLFRGTDIPLLASGVVLPLVENGQQFIATAGHVGIRNDNGSYNCATQTVSSFAGEQNDNYVQAGVKSGFGVLNSDRDVAVVKTNVVGDYVKATKIAEDPLDHMKTGAPIYMMGYSATGENGDPITRSPANIIALGAEANTSKDIAHPVIIGGLAIAGSADKKQLVVLSSVGRSYGPAFNDKIYPGDSGGGAFDKQGNFLGVITNTMDPLSGADVENEYGVRLTNSTDETYQVTVINLMNTATVKNLANAAKLCPAEPDPIIDGKK